MRRRTTKQTAHLSTYNSGRVDLGQTILLDCYHPCPTIKGWFPRDATSYRQDIWEAHREPLFRYRHYLVGLSSRNRLTGVAEPVMLGVLSTKRPLLCSEFLETIPILHRIEAEIPKPAWMAAWGAAGFGTMEPRLPLPPLRLPTDSRQPPEPRSRSLCSGILAVVRYR